MEPIHGKIATKSILEESGKPSDVPFPEVRDFLADFKVSNTTQGPPIDLITMLSDPDGLDSSAGVATPEDFPFK